MEAKHNTIENLDLTLEQKSQSIISTLESGERKAIAAATNIDLEKCSAMVTHAEIFAETKKALGFGLGGDAATWLIQHFEPGFLKVLKTLCPSAYEYTQNGTINTAINITVLKNQIQDVAAFCTGVKWCDDGETDAQTLAKIAEERAKKPVLQTTTEGESIENKQSKRILTAKLLRDAATIVVRYQLGSPSLIQRKLNSDTYRKEDEPKLIWEDVQQIMSTLEQAGIVGPAREKTAEGKHRAREVLVMGEQELTELLDANPELLTISKNESTESKESLFTPELLAEAADLIVSYQYTVGIVGLLRRKLRTKDGASLTWDDAKKVVRLLERANIVSPVRIRDGLPTRDILVYDLENILKASPDLFNTTLASQQELVAMQQGILEAGKAGGLGQKIVDLVGKRQQEYGGLLEISDGPNPTVNYEIKKIIALIESLRNYGLPIKAVTQLKNWKVNITLDDDTVIPFGSIMSGATVSNLEAWQKVDSLAGLAGDILLHYQDTGKVKDLFDLLEKQIKRNLLESSPEAEASQKRQALLQKFRDEMREATKVFENGKMGGPLSKEEVIAVAEYLLKWNSANPTFLSGEFQISYARAEALLKEFAGLNVIDANGKMMMGETEFAGLVANGLFDTYPTETQIKERGFHKDKLLQNDMQEVKKEGVVEYGTCGIENEEGENKDAIYVDTINGRYGVADGVSEERNFGKRYPWTIGGGFIARAVLEQQAGGALSIDFKKIFAETSGMVEGDRIAESLERVIRSEDYWEFIATTDTLLDVLEDLLIKQYTADENNGLYVGGTYLRSGRQAIAQILALQTPDNDYTLVELKSELLSAIGFGASTVVFAERSGTDDVQKNSYKVTVTGDSGFIVLDEKNSIVRAVGFTGEPTLQDYCQLGVNEENETVVTQTVADQYIVALQPGQKLILATDFITKKDADGQTFVTLMFGNDAEVAELIATNPRYKEFNKNNPSTWKKVFSDDCAYVCIAHSESGVDKEDQMTFEEYERQKAEIQEKKAAELIPSTIGYSVPKLIELGVPSEMFDAWRKYDESDPWRGVNFMNRQTSREEQAKIDAYKAEWDRLWRKALQEGVDYLNEQTNIKYDAELAALEERPVQAETRTPEQKEYDTKVADIKKRRETELKRMSYDELLKEFEHHCLALIGSSSELKGGNFRVIGTDDEGVIIDFNLEDGRDGNFTLKIKDTPSLAKFKARYKNVEWDDSDINTKYDAELAALGERPLDTEQQLNPKITPEATTQVLKEEFGIQIENAYVNQDGANDNYWGGVSPDSVANIQPILGNESEVLKALGMNSTQGEITFFSETGTNKHSVLVKFFNVNKIETPTPSPFSSLEIQEAQANLNLSVTESLSQMFTHAKEDFAAYEEGVEVVEFVLDAMIQEENMYEVAEKLVDYYPKMGEIFDATHGKLTGRNETDLVTWLLSVVRVNGLLIDVLKPGDSEETE